MSSASIEASATALAGSAWASTSGTSAAAISGPSAESGPNTRMREGPNSAYARSASTVVYRPVTGGSPASSAYAMPCGTSNAVSTTPATMSPPSHARR